MTKYQIGNRELEMGSKYLTELRDANDILDDPIALRKRLHEEGYLLIRGLHDREQVLKAQSDILQKMKEMDLLDPSTPVNQGKIGPDNKGAFFGGRPGIADLPSLLNVVNGPHVMDFFDQLLGGKAMTYDYKWVRAVENGGFTGFHYDIVYMGRGTKNVYTMWTPLGDVPLEKGPLALCLGSQWFDKIKETYGQMDVDRDNVVGWFSNDPMEIIDKFGGQWATTTFEAGDAIIFGMYLMHGSVANKSGHYRISADTRYQLSSEPVDERWVGKKPKGHYAWTKGETISMEKAKKNWKL